MSRPAVKYDSLESLKVTLQAKLGRAQREPEEALDFGWLRTASVWRSVLTESGLQVIAAVPTAACSSAGSSGSKAACKWRCGGAAARSRASLPATSRARPSSTA